jgi:hypothetical protein
VLLKSPLLPVPPLELRKAAQIGHLLCRHQPGDRHFDHPDSGLHSGLNIDNMAHLGGCACGFLFAARSSRGIGSPGSFSFSAAASPLRWLWEFSCSSGSTLRKFAG